MILYNLRTDGDHYRITKFNDDGDVEASYLCTEVECQCPAGDRPTCRHRNMLPKMIQYGLINSDWFYNYDEDEPCDMQGNTPSPESPPRTENKPAWRRI